MQVYREAQRNDPSLAAARANWEATQERVPQARAGLLPNVSLSASTNANYFGTDVDTDPRVRVNRGFGIGGLDRVGIATALSICERRSPTVRRCSRWSRPISRLHRRART